MQQRVDEVAEKCSQFLGGLRKIRAVHRIILVPTVMPKKTTNRSLVSALKKVAKKHRAYVCSFRKGTKYFLPQDVHLNSRGKRILAKNICSVANDLGD